MGTHAIQFKAVLWKNLVLLVRSWKSLILATVLVPAVLVVFVVVGQKVRVGAGGGSDAGGAGPRGEMPLGTLPHCVPAPGCVSLAYAPQHPKFDALVGRIAQEAAFEAGEVRGFASARAMGAWIRANPNTTAVALSFVPAALPDIQFVVWYNASLEAESAGCFSTGGLADEACAPTVPRMRVQAQAAVYAAAAADDNATAALHLDLRLRPMVQAPAGHPDAASVFLAVVCSIFVCGALVCGAVLVTLVSEKASGSRRMLYIHGLHNWVYWASWTVLFAAGVAVAAGTFAVAATAAGLHLFACSGPGLLTVVIVEYFAVMVALGTGLSVFFSSVGIAVGVSVGLTLSGLLVVQLLCSINLYSLWDAGGSPALWGLVAFPPFHLVKVVTDVHMACSPTYAALRSAQPSYRWSDLTSPPTYGTTAASGVWPASTSLWIMAAQMVVLVGITWFVDSWLRLRDALFCCRSSYYLPPPPEIVPESRVLDIFSSQPSPASASPDRPAPLAANLESEVRALLVLDHSGARWGGSSAARGAGTDSASRAPTPHPGPGLPFKVYKMCKRYGPVNALVDVSFGVPESSVLCLLGKNGAGKTSLLSILAGMTLPSSGDAEMYGHALSRNAHYIRSLVGFCPQSDLLWSELTPAEAVTLFAALKGLSGAQLEGDVSSILHQLLLAPVASTPIGVLSGGMRRMVSLAVALVGSPRVVLLDEPTVGLDAVARRAVWSHLASHKAGRVMILATHSMEEADSLGDKVGILVEGQLMCIGSPSHLKTTYSSGYSLVLTARDQLTPTLTAVVTHVTTQLPAAALTSAVDAELTFSLPPDIAATDLALLFDALDAGDDDDNLVVDWSVQHASSLEDVFLHLTA